MYSTLEQASCVLYIFSGYRVFKFTLFLAGFAAGFFFTYLLCSGYLVDHLPEKALEHKDQVRHKFGCSRTVACLPPSRYLGRQTTLSIFRPISLFGNQ